MANKLKASFLISKLKKISKPEKAKILQRFFKTGKGQYGEGDVFIGVMVPESRSAAKEFSLLPLSEVAILLKSKIHEVRLTGLLILVLQYQKAVTLAEKKKIYTFYINNLSAVNNWDLVDLTAPNIVGGYLADKSKAVLYKLAVSKDLWQRRVSMLACFMFIKNKDFADAIKMAKLHLADKHDLMHKAVGWMLREIGKRDVKVLITFLDENYKLLSRTALRYAIERLPEKQRLYYLHKK